MPIFHWGTLGAKFDGFYTPSHSLIQSPAIGTVWGQEAIDTVFEYLGMELLQPLHIQFAGIAV